MAKMRRQAKQNGEALLLTLLVLLVMYLAFLYVMRNVMSSSQMAGNNLTRQKNVQVTDIALRNLEQRIFDTYGDQPLEQTGVTQPWYRTVAANTSIGASYWNNCLGNSDSTARCGTISVAVGSTNLSYTAYAVVQTTGRNPDPYACNLQNFSAYYYDIFIHVVEASGVTSATTEMVYKLCVFDPNSNH